MTYPNRTKAGALAVIVSLSTLQLGNALAMALINSLGPGLATSLRVGFGALIMLPVLLLLRRSPKVPRRHVVVYGVVLALMQLSFYQAISHITLSMAVSIEFLVPLMAGCVLTRSRAARLPVVGAVAGLALIADYSAHMPIEGMLWALATGILLTIYIQVGTAAPAGTNPLRMLAQALWVAFPIVLVGQFMGPAPDLMAVGPMAGQAVIVAILTLLVPFSLELFAMMRLRPLPFAMMSSMDPVFASAVGVFGLSQYLELRQVLGLLILTVCGAWCIRAEHRASHAEA